MIETGAAAKILLVEDEQAISNFIAAILTASGYAVLHAQKGREAVSMAASHMPDLILLDLGLPDMDGRRVLEQLREWADIPVIVVSARQDEGEKIGALDGGAVDYVTKPFGNGELLARIRAALRLHARRSAASPGAAGGVFTFGGLCVDCGRRRVSVDGKAVHLTPIEYRILVLLARNAGKVLTRDHIIRQVWGPYAGDIQALRVNMANIRRKIEPNPADPRYILTEMGVGYQLADSGAPEQEKQPNSQRT